MRFRSALKIGSLCLCWYLTSSFNNVIGKQLLTQFPYPMTLTLVQLLSITVWSVPLLQLVKKTNNSNANNNNNNNNSSSSSSYSTHSFYSSIPSNVYWRIIVPLAVGKFLASVSSHFSIWSVSVSYAHTVKATMPLFTVAIQRVLFSERHSQRVYASLVPIIAGVFIATLTEMSFNTTGLVTALLATCGFSLQNIFSKRVLKSTGVHQFQLLSLLARLSLLMFAPVWVLFDVRSMMYHSFENTNTEAVIFLLFLDGTLNFLQNCLAFTVLNAVTPLTYAVANATKRIFIITLSILILGNQVSPMNVLGIAVALAGVFAYNRAKVLEKGDSSSSSSRLPLYVKSQDFV